MKKKIKCFLQIFSPIIVGSIIGILTKERINYHILNMPPFAPPSIVFPIVWSILYLFIGISYYLYRQTNNDPKIITIYYLQLILNFLWIFIFFIFKLYLLAIFWILLLILLTIYLIKEYKKRRKESAYLLIFYLLWLFFALYLSIGVYLLN